MPVYEYTADDERFYPTLGVTLSPGDTFEANANPDPAHFADTESTQESKPDSETQEI